MGAPLSQPRTPLSMAGAVDRRRSALLGSPVMSADILGRRWGSVAAVGVAMLLLGTISIAFADAAGQALIRFLGWLLVIGGSLHLWSAVRVRGWRGNLMSALIALLRVAVGALFVAAPRTWAAAIVVLLGIFFLVDGCFRVLLAIQVHPVRGWGFLLAGGGMALLLGLVMVLKLSGDAAFVIGVLFGLHLLLDGWTTLMLAAAARAAMR